MTDQPRRPEGGEALGNEDRTWTGSSTEIVRGGGAELRCSLTDYAAAWEPGKTPVMMHHGFARNSGFWNAWVPLLGRERRILRYDVRGCGGSRVDDLDVPITIEMLVADAIRVLDHFALEEVHWIGESSGGLVGMSLAMEHPGRVKTLVLCDTPTRLSQEVLDGQSFGRRRVSDAILDHGLDTWCRETLGDRLDLDRASPPLQDWYVEQMSITPSATAARLIDCFSQIDLGGRLSSLRTRSLLLAGDRSVIATAQQEALAAQIGSASRHVISNCGHGIGLLATEECVTAIMAFWEEVQRAAA